MRRFGWWMLGGVAATIGCSGASPAPRASKSDPVQPILVSADGADKASVKPLAKLPDEADRVAVAGFDGATAWLNVDHALTLHELEGRVVVVDFWTSCCINCMHTLPKLHTLEARFHDQPVTVVGVHSPKFDQEQEATRLRDVIGELEIEHPIAVDGAMTIWHKWGIEGWPTIVVLDTKGRAIWGTSGEPDEERLASIVESALDEGARKGSLAHGELKGVAREKDGSGALRYPGKVLVLADGGIAIADTGHHRVVITNAAGAIDAVVGSGLAGRIDGGFAEASFHDPRGMAELGGDLFVADTLNHSVRKIDRRAHRVSTVAGTGELGARPLAVADRPALDVALRSPWDLLAWSGDLLVALAGSHQIGLLDPKLGTVRAFAGNGAEARVDGELHDASFAQPSALATDGKEVFVLDSETSSVRAIEPAKGRVRTIVGIDLFVFGDLDGDAHTARLAHPIGMTYGDGALWVADSYNSKIRRVDPHTGATKSVLGGSDRVVLSEPAGLAFAKGTIVIADTDHHRVLRWADSGKGSAEPLALAGLAAPTRGVGLARAPTEVTIDPRDPVASLGALRVSTGPSSIHIAWRAPSGTKVNEQAPFKLTWVTEQGLARLPAPTRARGMDVANGVDVAIESQSGATKASLAGVLDLVICDEITHAVCVPVHRTVRAEIDIVPNAGPASATIDLPAATAP